jgi:CHAT domain-containing protein
LFRASEAALTATREAGHLAATKIVVADTRLRLGDVEGGWNALGDAVAAIPQIASARRRYVILLNLGSWMAESDLPFGAVRVLTSARDTALQTHQVLRVAESSLNLAKANARIGLMETARQDLALARPDPERNGRWGRSERAKYEYLAGVAEVERSARPALAVQAATEALAFFNGRQYAERVAPLHLFRGRAHAAAGEWDDAEADFASGIVTYRGYRDSLPSAQQRVLSQRVVWDLYEERLQLVARREPDKAFAAAEDGRSRTLLESLHQDGEDIVDPQMLQRELAPDVRVIYYAVLPKELLIWAIGREQVVFTRVPIDRSAFEREVTTLAEALQRDAPTRDWWPAAERAYDLLIAPVAATLPADARLVIVPDGALHRLPFAALRDRRRGRYLLETHVISLAPSATVLHRLMRRERQAGPPERLFAVADPSTGGAAPSLEGARQEVRSITGFYPRSEVISRERATKAAFLMSAPSADVVHFAGHATARPDYPLLASLEFAGEPIVGGTSELAAADIASMRLDHTRLVVLAACSTGTGPVHRGEGVITLARPFLIAGAPTVVAALWDIDDAASSALLAAFHEAYASTSRAAGALRAAQQHVMATNRPSVWAAFVVIGAPDA